MFPIEVVAFVAFCGPFLNHSAFIVWLIVTIAAVVSLFFCVLWARFVPAKVSLLLAVLTWSTLAWTAWRYL